MGQTDQEERTRSMRPRSIHLSTVHQVAELLRRANVTPDTTVITWSRNRIDLVLLRDFLEAACPWIQIVSAH